MLNTHWIRELSIVCTDDFLTKNTHRYLTRENFHLKRVPSFERSQSRSTMVERTGTESAETR